MKDWFARIPILDRFDQVADPANYRPVPDDWWIGVSDVVNSAGMIEADRYKAVNLAGAGTISAVSNALDGDLRFFVFAGDGARFVVAPEQYAQSADALSRAAMWAKRDMDLDLRVGMMPVSEARRSGFDVRVAYWRASKNAHYAMFMGGGLEWAESQLKAGAIRLDPTSGGEDPDLTGLSCQWGPVRSRKGVILSLIVRPADGVAQGRFKNTISEIVGVLGDDDSLNPMPPSGPEVTWPAGSIDLQSRVAHKNEPLWLRRLRVFAMSPLYWLIFKTGIRLGPFEPDRYRREVSENSDFRKYDDGLYMTLDCSQETVARLRDKLDEAAARGEIRYGIHVQDEALVTCVVPSIRNADHMHFVDGARGGYAAASRQLQDRPPEARQHGA